MNPPAEVFVVVDIFAYYSHILLLIRDPWFWRP